MFYLSVFVFITLFAFSNACSNFMMKFSDETYSGRTMDLGTNANFTITSWARGLPIFHPSPYNKIHKDVESDLKFVEGLKEKDSKQINFSLKEQQSLASIQMKYKKFYSEPSQDPLQIGWKAKYGSLGISGNWFGDQEEENYDDFFSNPSLYSLETFKKNKEIKKPPLFPTFYADSLNEHGLSCGFLMLIDTKYEKKDDEKTNVFAPLFCHYVAQNFRSVLELKEKLDDIKIFGPDILSQHFVINDARGDSLVIECVESGRHVYYESNSCSDDNENCTNYGIMTNEPTFDWHLENINHYEWKRSLTRQAIAIPGNFYPEERFLRIHMIKSGMKSAGFFDAQEDEKLKSNLRLSEKSSLKQLPNDPIKINTQSSFALTTQVMNSIWVPMGHQYGTDSSDSSDGSSEGSDDHTVFGIVRDHKNKILYWRDATNPTFRRINLNDVDFSIHTPRKSFKMSNGPYFVDVTSDLH